MILDLGTGDGRAVLQRASSEPDALVIGVDASATAMVEASRRALRQRVPNAMFLAAGVESLASSPLAASADLVTVTFPWGSLLRGVLGLDAAALAGVAATLRPAGDIEVLASVIPPDGVAGMASLGPDAWPSIRAAWASAGLAWLAPRLATRDDVARSGSTWGRRLARTGRSTVERPVWCLVGHAGTTLGRDGDGHPAQISPPAIVDPPVRGRMP